MDRFHFTGPVKEPRGLLPCFDIGVLCSESEGLSNTLLEYLDAGLVTVASNVGGNPEIISDGENGFLYPKGSVDELASILQRLVKRPKLSSSITRRGKKVLDLFSMKNMIKKHEHLYRS
jgi:glycosyltransferase involved in cell wall biosynthesis